MPVKQLIAHLESNRIAYVQMSHSPAYTAQELAASMLVPGRELAKTVVVKIDGRITLAVLGASYRIDIDRLKQATGASCVELASEAEFNNIFSDCDVGAMPPFGNLFGVDVVVDSVLAEDEGIAFNSGSHTELIRLKYEDFERLVKPRVATFASNRG